MIGKVRPRILMVMALLLLLGALASCGDDSSDTTAAPTTTAATTTSGGETTTTEATTTTAGPSAFDLLVEAAQAEGEVVLFTSLPEETFAALQAGFDAAYGITLVYERLNAAPIKEKVRAELAAGRLLTDIFAITNDLPWLEEVGEHLAIFTEEEMPSIAAVPAPDNRGENWVHGYQWFLGWAYNTDELSAEDLPENVVDFPTLEVLKGRVGTVHPVAGSSYKAWNAAMYDTLGQEAYEQWVRDYVVGLEAQITDTISPLLNQIAAGEIILAGPTHWAHGRQLFVDGAPIDYTYRDPVLMMGQAFSAFVDGPNPNAAKLFINWLLSQEGQDILCGNGSCASHLEVEGEVAAPEGFEIIATDWARAAEMGDYLVDFWTSVAGEV